MHILYLKAQLGYQNQSFSTDIKYLKALSKIGGQNGIAPQVHQTKAAPFFNKEKGDCQTMKNGR